MLKGSARQVLAFMAGAWAPLLQLSAVPVAVMLAVSLVSLRVMGSAMGDLMALGPNGTADPEVMARIARIDMMVMPLSILSMLAMVWLFVRVVRFYALGELSWASFGAAGVKPVLMTLVYGLGVGALTLVAYFISVLALAVPGVILAAAAGEAGAGIAVLLGAPAVLVFLLWFFCRFAVGLPGVALGASPDFFRDMWALAKGRSWGLPLRLLAACAVVGVILLPVYGVLIWSVLTPDLVARLQTAGPGGEMLLMSAIFDKLVPVTLLGLVVQVPFLWFTSLLFAEAFRRFSGR